MAGRTIHQLFAEYGESHRHPTNIGIHWLAVPVIYFSIVGLLMCIPSPKMNFLDDHIWMWLALGAVVAFYYFKASLSLFIGMSLFSAGCVWLAQWSASNLPWPLWATCSGLFILAWIAQFLGHGVEGKKPSFLKDLQFLLVGPAWLMAKVYRRVRIPY